MNAASVNRRSRWRFAPLLYAAVVYLAASATFGAGAVLSLVTFPASLLHMRQIPQPRGRVYWIGVVMNGLLFVASVAHWSPFS